MKYVDRENAYLYAKHSAYLSGFVSLAPAIEALFGDFVDGKMSEPELEKRILAFARIVGGNTPTQKNSDGYLGPSDLFDGLQVDGSDL